MCQASAGMVASSRIRTSVLAVSFAAACVFPSACSGTDALVDVTDDSGATNVDGGPESDAADSLEAVDATTTSDASALDASKDALADARRDTGSPKDASRDVATPDASRDAPVVSCFGRTFAAPVTIPMPAGTTVAGIVAATAASGTQYQELLFVEPADGDPQKLVRRRVVRLEAGDFTVESSSNLYSTAETVLGLAAVDTFAAWRLGEFSTDAGLRYRIRLGSDANLEDETWNLLGATHASSITAAWIRPQGSIGMDGTYFVRSGAVVVSSTKLANAWTQVVDLSAAGSHEWQGLAIAPDPSQGLRVFVNASVDADADAGAEAGAVGDGGATSGIVEHRAPNALASSVTRPVLVAPATDAVPFGASADGCALFARRANGAVVETLIFRR
ncbi:MAG: hypothetical protein U0169_24415 [Polyangiaceae bacterium]